jgi:hypothetical protein
MLTITDKTFDEDVIEMKKAIKQMHSTGWGKKQYMRFQMRCYENQKYSKEDLDYARKVFYTADEDLRESPIQGDLFQC